MPSIRNLATAALLASYVNAQTTPAANPAAPTGAGSAGSLENLVSYLLPSASVTSLSPSQSTAIMQGAENYLQQYTAEHPVSSLAVNIAIGQLGASTTPSEEQQSALQSLLGNAQSGILANPSAYVSSINSVVSPFGFASQIYSYESGLENGLRTVVAQDLGVSVPASTSSSTGQAPRATAVAAGAVAAAAGLLGVALL